MSRRGIHRTGTGGITAEACPALTFVTRRRRRWQMHDRRLRNTGGVFTGIRWDFFGAENKADACALFAAVEGQCLTGS